MDHETVCNGLHVDKDDDDPVTKKVPSGTDLTQLEGTGVLDKGVAGSARGTAPSMGRTFLRVVPILGEC